MRSSVTPTDIWEIQRFDDPRWCKPSKNRAFIGVNGYICSKETSDTNTVSTSISRNIHPQRCANKWNVFLRRRNAIFFPDRVQPMGRPWRPARPIGAKRTILYWTNELAQTIDSQSYVVTGGLNMIFIPLLLFGMDSQRVRFGSGDKRGGRYDYSPSLKNFWERLYPIAQRWMWTVSPLQNKM